MRRLVILCVMGLIFAVGAQAADGPGDVALTAKTLDFSICEDFESGYTLGSELRTHPDWFYESGHSGPTPQAGIGAAGSVGLSNGNASFTWLAQGFDWNDPTLTGVYVQIDMQTSAAGAFDDDRIGWAISDTDDSSDWIFGVQLDPGGSGAGGNIEAYWDGDSFGDNGGRSSIVDLPALSGNTWYRFREELTKLTATSCRIDVTLTELDAAGNEIGVIATGSISDTALLPNGSGTEIPNPGYFTASSMWPVYKNFNNTDGAADNACFGIYTSEPIIDDLTCEDFNTGFAVGSTVGTSAEWFDDGAGPVVTAGNGVAGSIGLAPSGKIFTWTANPFDWNAADFEGYIVQMDFKTDGSAHFDDDRIGWMITDDSASSSNIMGIQLDPGGSGYAIEGYWDGVTVADKRPHIVDLPALGADTWYRFRVGFTKLTATSASIDVMLTELDGAGNPLSVVATGSIPNTATMGADEPNAKYFTGPIWPAYKNHTGAAAPADNACFEIVTGAPAQYTLNVDIVGNGNVSLLPAGGLYDGGTVVELTANADPGWQFFTWTDDLAGNLSPAYITMDGDKTVTATFIVESSLVAGDVIISAFQSWNAVTGQDPAEFIELFNTTDQPIALDNMQLTSITDNNSDGVVDVDWALAEDLTGKVIAPNSFFLIAEAGVAAPSGLHDVETDMDLATGEGGVGERAISLSLSIDGQHMDYVLYGFDNGSTPAGEIPPGDLAFDGVSYPRIEVIRNTLGTASYQEGVIRRVSAPDLYAGYDVDGYYTDEAALGDGNPDGVWTCPHDNTNGAYEARNTLSAPVHLVPFNLTVNVVGNGSVTLDPAGGTYFSGTEVQLTANPDPGWLFSMWSDDLTGSTNPASVTMAADMTVTGTFVEDSPVVTGEVIISAFQSWNAVTGQDPAEFIELFNATSRPISLEGMELISRTDNNSDGVLDIDWALSADLTGKVIAPFSFFLIAEAGVAAPGGLHDVETDMDLATGEGGSTERAISIQLAINGTHMDYVLYGRHDGSDPAGELPPGDIPFDGSSWPRVEVVRNTLGSNSFEEGLAQRVLTELNGAAHDIEGYYTDEVALGDGFPEGVWFCPHSTSFGDYEARNTLSPPLDSAVPAAAGYIMARAEDAGVTIEFETNFTDANALVVTRKVGSESSSRTWTARDFANVTETTRGLHVSLRDQDQAGWPRQYELIYRSGGADLVLDKADLGPPAVLNLTMSAYPNPFNPRVEIKFTIPKPASTQLYVYDSRGRLVQRLVSGVRPAGEDVVYWTGEDMRGQRVSSGVYHLLLKVDQQRIIKTVTLVK